MKEQPIITPVDPSLIRKELTDELFLRMTNKAGNEIYIFKADEAPNTMREVGRLREEAFRFYGGGTGKELDIDEFDTDPNGYTQLIVWDPTEQAILGGYRFIYGSEVEMDNEGRPKLATAEIFDFSPKFLQEYLPYTVELGRSFVSLPYQSTRMGTKSLFALDNLWDGLGALTILKPNIKYFYGKVTMYDTYNRYARNLILYFMRKHFPDHENLVTPIEPVKITLTQEQIDSVFDSDNFKSNYRSLNKEVRKQGVNIPPLVSAYMSLSPKMRAFGTAINKEFGDVEETGILINIDEILDDKKERHIMSFSLSKERRKALWHHILRKVALVKR